MNVRTGITIASLLCAVALGSISLAQPPPDEDWNAWRNDKLHYTLKWPDSWSQDRSNLGRYGLQRLLKNQAPGVQIQVLNMPTGVLAAEQLAQVAAAMAKNNPAMQEKVSEESGELGGATGIAAVYNGQQDGEAVRTLAHFISTADGLFVLVGITPQQTADRHWEEVGQIVGSFRYGLDQTEPEDGTKQPQTPTEPVTYSLQVPEGWTRRTTGAGYPGVPTPKEWVRRGWGVIERLQRADDPAFFITIGRARLPHLSLQQLEQLAAVSAVGNPLMQQQVAAGPLESDRGTALAVTFSGTNGLALCKSLAYYLSAGEELFVVVATAPADAAQADWNELAAIVGSFQPGPPAPVEPQAIAEP